MNELLQQFANELAGRLAIPKPNVCILEYYDGGAPRVGVGYGGQILVHGNLGFWNEREWFAVMAHELAHIRLNHMGSTIENEFAADALAAQYVPAVDLASALAKLAPYDTAHRLMFTGLTLSHPPIGERVERLLNMRSQ